MMGSVAARFSGRTNRQRRLIRKHRSVLFVGLHQWFAITINEHGQATCIAFNSEEVEHAGFPVSDHTVVSLEALVLVHNLKPLFFLCHGWSFGYVGVITLNASIARLIAGGVEVGSVGQLSEQFATPG